MNEESLFAAVREKATRVEREAFLNAACGDDALRQRVARLLAAHEHAAGILDREADGPDPGPDPVIGGLPAADGPGAMVGRYKLREQIGEGGFGLVFVAEQTEPVRRKVAVKLIKPGMDTREVVARFEAERQALAMMDHPHIARVLDAGETDSGHPYFVMELVRGVAITEFCDQSRLTTRERLGLFVQVCQAVQHAHTKGVIHRDLKPSNVLVTLHDGRPVPKVIDFGVAKALNQQLTEHSIYTRFAQMVGTPTYMSPEQAELSGLDVDTRSDVYSLGVLLYELLTGTTPFDKDRLKTAGLDEIRRIIREEDPPRPSTRVSTLGLAATTVSANRQTDPRRLSRSLRGELDWIVLKALEKDRNRRYETAADMARDVERYLRDQPVEASPPSAAYRVRKFLQRNRGPALAVSACLVLLLGGTVGTTVGLVRAEERAEGERLAKLEAERAAAAEREARLAAERAGRLARESEADTSAFADFLVHDILSAGRPDGERGGLGVNVTVRRALQAAQQRIDATFKDRPRAEAVARHSLGLTYRLIGDLGQAERHLRRAAFLRKQVLGPEHEETLQSQNSLGVVLNGMGKHPEAVPLLKETLELQRAKLGDDHPSTLTTMVNLGASYQLAGRLDLALPLYEQALERRTATRGSTDRDTILALAHVARGHHAAKRPDLAIPLFERVLELYRTTQGPDHSGTIATLSNLAHAYKDAGQPKRALPLFEEAAVRVERRQYVHEYGTRIVWDLIQLCEDLGQFDRAEPWRRKLLTRRKERAEREGTFERDAISYAAALALLANNLLAQRKFADAEAVMRECLAIREKKPEAAGWTTFGARSMLGASLAGQGKYDEAESSLLDGYKGLKRLEAQIPPQVRDLRLREAIERLVQLYDAWDKPAEAARWRTELEAARVVNRAGKPTGPK